MNADTTMFNNSKVFGVMPKLTNNAETGITTLRDKSVRTFVTISCEDIQRYIESNALINYFDLEVMNSAYSLFQRGFNVVTLKQITYELIGSHTKVQNSFLTKVKKSIDKMRHIDVVIDCTEEYLKRHLIIKGERRLIKNYILPLEIEMHLKHDDINISYKFLSEPPIMKYASDIKQIISVSKEYVDIKDVCRITDENVIIYRQVIKQIELIKNNKNNYYTNKISIAWANDAKDQKGIMAKLLINKDEYSNARKKKHNIVVVIKKILDSLIAKKYIIGYSVITSDKNEIKSFEIHWKKVGTQTA